MNLIKAIDKNLNKYLPKVKEEPKILHKAMRYSVFSGGKRIRPVVVLGSCMACGGKVNDAIAAACAVELVHTYSLIHDDLPSMDDDDCRRGKPACHVVFGEANAILAGDALLTLAFNIVAANIAPKKARTVLKELSEAAGTYGMVGGQAADLTYKSRKRSPEIINYINYLKTARLFEASAKIGAVAAGADDSKIRKMAVYGANLGIAFQITDDMIDREGYAEIFGPARSRRDAERSIGKAQASIKTLGLKGGVLRKIADNVLMRVKQ